MARQQFRSCFISAPFGANTSVLRSALEERGIRWADQTSIEPGESWLDVLDHQISMSDFVCVVLPSGERGSILFEVGVAYAKRKPILAFVNSPLDLPGDIASLTYVRTDPANSEAVSRALDTFIEHAKPMPPRRTGAAPSKPKRKEGSIPRGTASSSGLEFERKTADLLRKAGFIVSDPSDLEGADFAVWIDELEHSLGNPLLVEVKSGNLSSNRLRSAASQLRRYVAGTHGRCGLLIYWDNNNREFPVESTDWPLVLQLSGATLMRLLSQERVAEELVELRNAAVHRGS